jgi:hypothetical protein
VVKQISNMKLEELGDWSSLSSNRLKVYC